MTKKILVATFALALALIPAAAEAGEFVDLPPESGNKSSMKAI